MMIGNQQTQVKTEKLSNQLSDFLHTPTTQLPIPEKPFWETITAISNHYRSRYIAIIHLQITKTTKFKSSFQDFLLPVFP